MHLDLTALGEVATVSVGVTVAVVVFALGLARPEGARAQQGGTSALGRATLCFLACAAVVAYGIHLIVPQFH
ncbi:hypothetical protein ACFZC7_32275 [Streptomyces massasporeus]|uniref:hypothetical protein n=1 Tax=Streptomyces massasporeus TaxID=67324 RepID=UPI0036F0106C